MTLLEKSILAIDEKFWKNLLTDKIYFGYWRKSEKKINEDDFPYPTDFIVNWNDVEEKQQVLKNLKKGSTFKSWRGWSNCRLCGVENGSKCLVYKNIIYPEGLIHYIEKHNVKPPKEILDKII